jgi:glycosyltransferase involved in cell wall biosynthesis
VAAAGELVLLSDYFGPGGATTGGAGIAALDSFEALAARGARVRMVGGYLPVEASAHRTSVETLGGADLRPGGARSALKAIYNPDSRRRLAAFLADLDPATTVIVLHQWTRWLTPSALGLLSAFPLMVYMHDYFWLCPNGAYYNFRSEKPCALTPMGPRCMASACDRAGYGHKLVRLARHAAKGALVHGDPSRRLFLHVSELSRRTGVRLAPAETHEVLHNPLPSPLVSTRDPPPGSVIYDVGYFGRLEPEKGVMDLCRAVRHSGRRALFVGSGSLAAEIAAMLGPAAVVGWADRPLALELMRQCRTVALPSRWPETWGLVAAEALALARPALVSRRAGSAELVERFGGGETFDPGEPGELLHALDRLLKQAPDAAAMAAVADKVREALSPDLHAQRLIDLAKARWDVDVQAAPSRRRPQATPMQAPICPALRTSPGRA